MGHVSVLSKESIEVLQPRPGSIAVDCTLGGGGHALLLLEAIQPGGRLLAIDRDPLSVERARAELSRFDPPPILIRGDFAELETIAGHTELGAVQAVLFDFGISSNQLDDPERGFSFRNDGPLDMRMDPEAPLTAERIVNQMDRRELAAIIRQLGEERWADRIAQFIVQRRPLRTTRDLAAAVEAAIPRGAWPKEIHPATRTFQAVRMSVNDELGSIERGLKAATKILTPGGRMATICFHSLEDRMVKSYFNVESRDCLCPPHQPVCTCAHRASLRILTRKPVRPSPEEVVTNPRSRSARLRAAEKL